MLRHLNFFYHQSIHHDPIFYADPEEFIPERFEEEPSSSVFMPFGAGKSRIIFTFSTMPFFDSKESRSNTLFFSFCRPFQVQDHASVKISQGILLPWV